MGIRLIVEVLDYAPTTLTHRERLLLVVLAEDANDDTRLTWGSVQSPTVLRRADLSRTQLYEVIKSLTAKGLIKKVAAGQRNGTAKYVITPQSPAERDADESPQSPAPQDTDPTQSPAHRDSDGKFSVPHDGTRSGSQSPAGRDFRVPLDGTPTPHPSGVSTNTHAPAPPEESPPDHFDAFWQAYPKRVGKGTARKAWAAALKRGADPAAVVIAAAKHAAAWTAAGTDRQWIPYPSSWLNGERYDDDQLPASQPAPGPQPPAHQQYADKGIF